MYKDGLALIYSAWYSKYFFTLRTVCLQLWIMLCQGSLNTHFPYFLTSVSQYVYWMFVGAAQCIIHVSCCIFSLFLSLYESLWMTSSNLLIIIIFYLCKVYCSADLWFFNFNDFIFLFLEFLCFFSRAACFYFIMSRSYIMNLIPLSLKHIYFKVCISYYSLRS